VEKVFAGRKTFNEIKNAVSFDHTRRTASLKEVWCIPSHLTFKSLAVSLRTTRFNIQNFYMVLALR
jgi:hypothetical protein